MGARLYLSSSGNTLLHRTCEASRWGQPTRDRDPENPVPRRRAGERIWASIPKCMGRAKYRPRKHCSAVAWKSRHGSLRPHVAKGMAIHQAALTRDRDPDNPVPRRRACELRDPGKKS